MDNWELFLGQFGVVDLGFLWAFLCGVTGLGLALELLLGLWFGFRVVNLWGLVGFVQTE